MRSQTGKSDMPTAVEQHPPTAVDEKLPLKDLILYGFQHVLVMAASPITAVFLVAQTLGFDAALTVSIISATFLVCGLGSILQSFGPASFGARLPFIMVPGGAPIAIFLAIATQTDVQTAVGAVLMTGVFYFLALPVFRRLLRFFPPIVVGTMLLLVAVNLVKIYGGTITGRPGSDNFDDPVNVGLALATIALTVIFSRVFTGTLQRVPVMLGLIAGTLLAAALGRLDVSGVMEGSLIAVPQLFPFGLPRFDIIASLPLIIFSIISMAEATGQTIATAEIVDRKGDSHAIVPRTIRGDAVASLVGGLFGTFLILTSGENDRHRARHRRPVALCHGHGGRDPGHYRPDRPGVAAGQRFAGPGRGWHGGHCLFHYRGDRHPHSVPRRSARTWRDVYAGLGPCHGAYADPSAGSLQPVSAVVPDDPGQWSGHGHDHGGGGQCALPVQRPKAP
jgi:hypothetical protein